MISFCFFLAKIYIRLATTQLGAAPHLQNKVVVFSLFWNEC